MLLNSTNIKSLLKVSFFRNNEIHFILSNFTPNMIEGFQCYSEYVELKAYTTHEAFFVNIEETIINEDIHFVLFFISQNTKFYTTEKYFPSFLLSTSNNNYMCELLQKEFLGKICRIEEETLSDLSKSNHLNIKPDKYLRVFCNNENTFKEILRYLKQFTKKFKKSDLFVEKGESSIYKMHNYTIADIDTDDIYNIVTDNELNDITIENIIKEIHEFDIPHNIDFMSEKNLRCGKNYTVKKGDVNVIYEETTNITLPDILIMSLDIETTKEPLKFPSATTDEVFLISISSNYKHYLLINSEYITANIPTFQYYIQSLKLSYTFETIAFDNEKWLLNGLNNLLDGLRPDILTTYNGDIFDIPFLEQRTLIYGLEFKLKGYMHLDCYKWVKRDSYLPMGSQGLKAATKSKLGYVSDEIDPEEMMWYARNDPEKMCVYSVSDAVSTYLLYTKYVHPFIFSLCMLIPMNPFDVLSKGSGTLCETLLISESKFKKIIIPNRKIQDTFYYEGRLCEEASYVGGHVECLQSGIFRQDFKYDFTVAKQSFEEYVENFKTIMMNKFSSKEDNDYIEQQLHDQINNFLGNIDREDTKNYYIQGNPLIYHLDVAAMYPNIILTNRLQPYAVINNDRCIQCSYYGGGHDCQRKLNWKMKINYIPPDRDEISGIKFKLKEGYVTETELKKADYYKKNVKEIKFIELEEKYQEKILLERIKLYSKNIYSKTNKTQILDLENIVCQREEPFYIDVVRRFRDKRYDLKEKYKEVKTEYTKAVNLGEDSSIHEKKMVILESLQVAHKCILNSFYGYVMRKGARWYSMEMAAIVCKIGSNIIQTAKNLIEKMGIVLELDTDGIWCILPNYLPDKIKDKSDKTYHFINEIINSYVQIEYANNQYQTKDISGNYVKTSINTVMFEIDGPYKAMILPASLEEGKNIKKKYIVINKENKMCELKGFEIKRRGELKIIKKFQDELFGVFTHGSTLEECYIQIKEVCDYWLSLIYSHGEYLNEHDILDLFSESKNMSKDFGGYLGRKTVATCTILRLSEILGENILLDKGVKCEFIISKYPTGSSVTERAIPVQVFHIESEERKKFLQKWTKKSVYEIKDVIDWSYYQERLENVILRIVVIPASHQKINIFKNYIKIPKWVKDDKMKTLLTYSNVIVEKKITKEEDSLEKNRKVSKQEHPLNSYESKDLTLKEIIKKKKNEWVFLGKMLKFVAVLSLKNNSCQIIKKNIKYSTSITKKLYFIAFNQPLPHERHKNIININSGVNKNQIVNFFNKIEGFTVNNSSPTSIQNKEYNFTRFSLNEESYQIHYHEISNYFLSYNIRKIDSSLQEFENLISLQNTFLCQSLSVYDYFEIHYLSSILYNGKSIFYHIIKDKKHFFSNDSAITNKVAFHIKKEEIFDYFKEFKNHIGIVVTAKDDPNLRSIEKLCKNNNFLLYKSSEKRRFALTTLNDLLNQLVTYVERLRDWTENIFDLYDITGFPLFDIEDRSIYEILDFIFYKKLTNEKKFLVYPQEEECNVIDTLSIKSTYCSAYSIQISISNTLVASILKSSSIILEDSFTKFYFEEDFLFLQNFIKNIFNNSNKGKCQKTYQNLMNHIPKWFKKESKNIPQFIRNKLLYLQKKYLFLFYKQLEKIGCKIIAFNNESIIIDTDKRDYNSVMEYFKYIEDSFHKIKIFDTIKIKINRIYSKFIIQNFQNFCFLHEDNTGKETYAITQEKISKIFLELLFNSKLENNYFYDLILSKKPKNISRIVTMLNIYQSTKDIEDLKQSCYKMLKLNLYENDPAQTFIEHFCDNCNNEIYINVDEKGIAKCFHCLQEIDNNEIYQLLVQKVYKTIKYAKKDCENCNYRQEKIYQEHCSCGSLFKYDKFMKKVNVLKKIIKGNENIHQVNSYINYFMSTKFNR